MCVLRKAAEAVGFSDPKGKLATADKQIAEASKAAKQQHPDDPVQSSSKKPRRTPKS